MQFDKDKFHLVYFEAFLEEYNEEVDYAEYSRVEPRWEWKRFIRVESFRDLKEAFERAAELLWTADYDDHVEILGIFRGNEMIYSRADVVRIANEIHQEVTA
ncbi:hypothetical protein [Geoglobus ahangari]